MENICIRNGVFYEVECAIDNYMPHTREFNFKREKQYDDMPSGDGLEYGYSNRLNEVFYEAYRHCLYAALIWEFKPDKYFKEREIEVRVLDFRGFSCNNCYFINIEKEEVYIVRLNENGETHIVCKRRDVIESMIGLFSTESVKKDIEIRECVLPVGI